MQLVSYTVIHCTLNKFIFNTLNNCLRVGKPLTRKLLSPLTRNSHATREISPREFYLVAKPYRTCRTHKQRGMWKGYQCYKFIKAGNINVHQKSSNYQIFTSACLSGNLTTTINCQVLQLLFFPRVQLIHSCFYGAYISPINQLIARLVFGANIMNIIIILCL